VTDDNPAAAQVIRLDKFFVEGLKTQADSMASRVAAVVVDETQGVGFELCDVSREAAITLFMTLKALALIIESVMDSQEQYSSFPEASLPEIEGMPRATLGSTCFMPVEYFLKIMDCTRMSVTSQDVLEKYGISLIYH
jgi:hypothetical protein